MTKVYDTATDLITFARSSSGTALRRVGYGENLVDNDDFTSGLTSWEQDDTAFSVVGGELVYDASGDGSRVGQVVNFTAGKVYQLTFDATISSTFRLQLVDQISNDSGAQIILSGVSTGANTVVFVPNSSFTYLVFRRVTRTNNSTLDNVSVKEVIFNRATDDLVLFNHPDDIPRIEYAADGSLKGLLIEEQRTNLRTYSTVPDSNNNYRVNATSVASTETAPDGSTDAVLLTATGTSADNAWDNYNNTYGANLNDTMTYSFFIKAEAATTVSVGLFGATRGMTYNFDTDTVTATGSDASAHVEHYGNDWVRVGVTTTKTNQFHYWQVSLGGTTKTAHIWGVQLEVGSFPTSYIPTAGSTVTRSPDIASIPVSAFGYNQDAGTFVADYTPVTKQNQYAISVTTSFNYMALLWGNAGNAVRFQVTAGSATSAQLNTLTGTVAGTRTVHAGAYAANDFAACNDGGTVLTDTLGDVPSGLVQMKIGSEFSDYLNGHIKSIQYYPRRLTNIQLQELTS